MCVARMRANDACLECVYGSECVLHVALNQRESEHTWQEELNGQVSVDLSRAYKHQA